MKKLLATLVALGAALLTPGHLSADGAAERPFDYFTSGSGHISGLWLSRDGQRLVVAGNVGLLEGGWFLWSVADGKKLQSGKMRSPNAPPQEFARAHEVALSPNGKYLVCGGSMAKQIIFETSTGEVVKELEGHRSTIHQVLFTPDGKYLVSSNWSDSMLRVWRVADWRRKRCQEPFSRAQPCECPIAAVPKGRRLRGVRACTARSGRSSGWGRRWRS